MPAVEMQVNMEFEFMFMLSIDIRNGAAPSHVLRAAAIRGDGLPRRCLIEVRKQRMPAAERNWH